MKRAAEVPTSSRHSDTETVSNDLSILRKPIKTSVNGLNEAKKAYEDGTDEVRNLLSNECDIIYECKVCRNLFRSLANFISHKRVYCKATYCSSLQYGFHNDGNGFSQDLSTIVQAEENFIGTAKNGKNSEKDLSSIVERLIKREKASRLLKLSDFYEQINSKLTQEELLQQRHVQLHLDVVPESNVAVYQTVKNSKDDDGDNIKAEVIEIQNISDKSHTILGPDGKFFNAADLPEFPDDHEKLAQPFECEVCNCKFATEKTLKLHIETKHIPSTYVFQCPSCSKTFLQVGQVIRHLTNDHKKSMRRVRLMRDSILKRRTRIDEVHVKGPSRELARLQSDKERTDSQNKAWLDNLEDLENGSKNVCLFCGRQFDRRAVLLSHHKVCQLKKKPSTRISLTKKVGQVPVLNSWNDREFDDSSNSNSNSNSLDGVPMDESSLPSLKDKSKLTIKTEPDELKTEIEETVEEPVVPLNRRRKNRSLKSTIMDETTQSDDDKSLNMGWAAEETIKKEENTLPAINHANNASDSISNNNVSGVEIKTDEPNGIKEEKRTRTTNTGSQKATRASDPKPKLTSSHCKYCFKKFSNASNLRRHITMSHFGPKNFSCNLCTFRGRRKSDILGHMRTKHDSERPNSLKFVQANDKPAPKPKAPLPTTPSSFSRRKEKQAVLQDDQEEIYIDSEAFVLEETADQFKLSLDQSNENSNIGDTAADDATEASNEAPTEESTSTKQNASLKRKGGRPKTNEPAKKLNRSPAPVDKKECKSVPTRRPVRNRIMPVKKDFVYDLSTLLKKDYKDFQDGTHKEIASPTIAQPEPQPQSPQPQPPSTTPSSSSPSPSPSPTPSPSPSPSSAQLPLAQQSKSNHVSPVKSDNKTSKRRQNVLPHATEDPKDNSELPTDQTKNDSRKQSLPPPPPPPPPSEASPKIENASNQNSNDSNSIKGAADAMAEQAVKANRAAFFKPPELPTERPVAMPQRQFDTGTMKDWPLLKSPSAIFANYKSKLSNLKVPGLKRKKRSCLLKNHKNRLHDKHNKIEANGALHTGDTGRLKGNDTEQQIPEIMKISSKLVDKIQLQCVQQSESDTIKATVQSNNEKSPANSKQSECVPATTTTTPRRMTLLERLAENKTKKLNESLSRMTIANSDNESDDD